MAAGRAEDDAQSRLDRLASDGRRGGGIPLPLLFRAILEELIDNGSATTDRLTEVVSEVLEFKQAQVLATWQSWKHLTLDTMAQLEDRQIVTAKDGTWRAARKFRPGKRMVVIPERPEKSGAAIGITVWPAGQRAARVGAEEAQITVGEFASRLRSNVGLRRVDAARVQEIRDSIRDFGDFSSDFPVIEDYDGNLLDGYHRRAVNGDWPARKVRVGSEADMLRVALIANVSAAWTRAEWRRLGGVIRAVGGVGSKQEVIRQALAEHPEASHNQIGMMLGYASGNKQVGEVCREQTSECRHGETGRGARTDRQRAANPEKEARNAEIVRVRDEERLDWGEIGSRFGLKAKGAEDAYRKATGARDREPSRQLFREDAGEVPPPAPQGESRAPRTRPTGLMQVLARIAARWDKWEKDDAPDDPAAEISDLEELQREFNARVAERIAALRG